MYSRHKPSFAARRQRSKKIAMQGASTLYFAKSGSGSKAAFYEIVAVCRCGGMAKVNIIHYLTLVLERWFSLRPKDHPGPVTRVKKKKKKKVLSIPSSERRGVRLWRAGTEPKVPKDQMTSASASLLLSSLALTDSTVYEPQKRALLGTAAHLCEVVVPVNCPHTTVSTTQMYWLLR